MSQLWNYRFTILLCMLFIVIMIVPVFLEFSHRVNTVTSDVAGLVVTTLLLMAATFAVSDRQRVPYRIGALMLLSLVNELITAFLPNGAVAVLHHGLRIVFFLFIIADLMGSLFRARVITYDTIFASLCIYLLIGTLWSNMYAICDILLPGAIGPAGTTPGAGVPMAHDMSRTFRMLYFSLVTLSTVGYGDFVPLTPTTRMLAAVEALIGQCYLLVMVSRLVGLHIAQMGGPPQQQS